MHREFNAQFPVIHPFQHLMTGMPGEEGAMYSLGVTTIEHGPSTHFILHAADAGDELPLGEVGAAPVCQAVMRTFNRYCVGKSIGNVQFYVWQAGQWVRYGFAQWKPELIDTEWPEAETGEALGEPTVQIVPAEEYVTPPADDAEVHPFRYWWHTAMSKQALYDDPASGFQKLVWSHCNGRHAVKRQFGDLTYDAWEQHKHSFLYAVSPAVLDARIAAIAKTDAYRGHAQGWRGYRDHGCCAVVFLVGRTLHLGTMAEPGHHNVEQWDIVDYVKDFAAAGYPLQELPDGRFEVTLPTELKTGHEDPDGEVSSVVYFRRGTHTFTVVPPDFGEIEG